MFHHFLASNGIQYYSTYIQYVLYLSNGWSMRAGQQMFQVGLLLLLLAGSTVKNGSNKIVKYR